MEPKISDLLYLVEIKEDVEPKVWKFSSKEHLLERLRSLSKSSTGAQVFIFSGQRWHISKGPHRYLITADGDKTPIFPDSEVEIDDTGTLVASFKLFEASSPDEEDSV